MIFDHSIRKKTSKRRCCGLRGCCLCLAGLIVFLLVTTGMSILFLFHVQPDIVATQCRTTLDTEVFSQFPTVNVPALLESYNTEKKLSIENFSKYQGIKTQLKMLAKLHGHEDKVQSNVQLDQATDEFARAFNKLNQTKHVIVEKLKDEEGMKNEIQGLCDGLDTLAIPLGVDVPAFLRAEHESEEHAHSARDLLDNSDEFNTAGVKAETQQNCLQATKNTVMDIIALKESIEKQLHAILTLKDDIEVLVNTIMHAYATSTPPDEHKIAQLTEKVEITTEGVRRVTIGIEMINQTVIDIVPNFKICLEKKCPIKLTTLAIICCISGFYILMIICSFTNTTSVRKKYNHC